MDENYVVTPWEVSGEVNYDELIKKFGTKLIDASLLKKFEKCGKIHPMLKRKLFFSHRDMDWIFEKREKGEKFCLYTGRGPSGKVHIGHLIPLIFTKYLQDTFDAELYFQMTDDEKFLVKENMELEDTIGFSKDNLLDVIACGFNPKRTFVIQDTEHVKAIYKIALRVAKKVTFSTAKAVFGFTNESNVGIIFFPAMQAAPAFLPSVRAGKNVPCLIPCAIDQDPYWRMARDVAPKLSFYKPAAIHSKFIWGLGRGGKMSASLPETCIFTTDAPKEIHKKIMNAFSGGQPTVKEQREKGGNPDVCSIYHYFYYLFEENDSRLEKIFNDCKTGAVTCGECKQKLSERIQKFALEHQKKRERAKDKLEEFMLKD